MSVLAFLGGLSTLERTSAYDVCKVLGFLTPSPFLCLIFRDGVFTFEKELSYSYSFKQELLKLVTSINIWFKK